ncbi:hypothetical protein [Emticicia sp. SJ17W-69]|uniref:hypothetical protein n=1 Tax=Emticicia sp. SJ17W-69 TaxID=3421657 RepID=UPI003EBAD328
MFLFSLPKISLAQVIPSDSIKKAIFGSLTYLSEKQCTETIAGKQYAGEWEAFMEMKEAFLYLGGRNKYRDSNCFTMAGIHNILAEIYLADTSQKQILPMLRKVFPEVLSYSTGTQFNFWKKLPPNQDLKWGKETKQLVHRPTNFRLKGRFINNAANVANDADDTALGNLAIWYNQKIFGKNDSLKMANPTTFDSFLDKNRKNRHWYNYLFHGFKNSGAYMTWFGQEAEFENWHFYKNALHNLIFFLPISIAYPHPYKAYIPWGTNDLDVVVNANVLTYLSKNNLRQASTGSEAANRLIEKHTKRGRWNRMGIYYPNRYHLHFAAARALAAGDTGLLPTSQFLLKHLVKTQNQDGSYESKKIVNKRDILQSTAYATLAMLYLKESGVDIPKSLIDKSIYFLYTQKGEENKQVWWNGGVYFSGGTVVRNLLYFTSDAYTTALVSMAFQKYLNLYKS